MLDAFFQAFQLIFRLDIYLYVIVGLVVGMFVGAMPGLTTVLALAVLLPVTFKVEPMLGVPFLIGIVKGGIFGGSIPAVLVGIPGTGAAIATCIDGPPLTRKGYGRKGLEMALFASVTGDTIGSILTLSLIGLFALLVLLIGPPEVFAIIVFSLVLIASVSSESGLKGAIAAFFGLGLGFIGTDATTGATRMTFGLNALSGGIPLIPLIIGVFAIPEILMAVESKEPRFVTGKVSGATGERLHLREFMASWRTLLRSSMIGGWIGAVPGVGQVVAAFVGYSAAKRASSHPETYGKGELDGVAAPEAANNAVNGPAMVPLLTLGIPGDNTTAIMLGAFVAHGIRPGPQIFQEQGALMYALLIVMVLANLLFLAVGYLLLKPFAMAIQIKKAYLIPIIVILAFVGTLSTGDISDLGIMLAVGFFSYVLRKLGFDLAPLVIAFVLAEPLEYTLSQSLLYARGAVLGYFFLARPIAGVFLAATLIWVAWMSVRHRFRAPRPAEP
ncbi:MAG: tripartite tricarboxylate transporter permease [Candidatus Tectomicrobia bacterium]|uniref:Tripartite tricarboxylate transporter permease n=1 Tax=Tectimicrobiota bacterium TaxID=2528274 RepID=A0A932HW55_UNCTE|nr:tripartite tricarboxylate transporter permease [Candidatus Tectomicrobia bacterium]